MARKSRELAAGRDGATRWRELRATSDGNVGRKALSATATTPPAATKAASALAWHRPR